MSQCFMDYSGRNTCVVYVPINDLHCSTDLVVKNPKALMHRYFRIDQFLNRARDIYVRCPAFFVADNVLESAEALQDAFSRKVSWSGARE
jgi:hypothetical protein